MDNSNALLFQKKQIEKISEKIKIAYGTSFGNWNDLNIFAGNFVNCGYWKNIPLHNQLTMEHRIASAVALYEQVATYLQLSSRDNVLEVGCGRGVGAAYLHQCYQPAYLLGVDLTPSQIQKARALHYALYPQIDFLPSSAEDTFFKSHAFDKVYSVEMVQHLASLEHFAQEMHRILKKSGRLVITTYFPTGNVTTEELAERLPLIDEGLENPTPFPEVITLFQDAGFSVLEWRSIGQEVFAGYDAWSRQVEANNSLTHHYLKAFQEKMIDYYILALSVKKE